MTIMDFHMRYCFLTFKDDELDIQIYFYPPDSNNKGAMNTTFSGGRMLGGEYTIKQNKDGSWEISWSNDVKFWFIPTELGFNLLDYITMSVTYSFARPIQ